jgi:hypothetical protein
MSTIREQSTLLKLDNDAIEDDDAAQLVSEFPIPPPYYKLAVTLTPPPIPHEKLVRSTKKSYIERLKTLKREEEEERRRFGEDFALNADGVQVDSNNAPDVIVGSKTSDVDRTNRSVVLSVEDESDIDNGPFLSVFGPESYVEDPTLIPVQDDCHDPKEVQKRVTQLNKDILQDFVTLVGDLVNNPEGHQICRDRLLRNIESILKECNKFREHQSREILIDTLEQQLKDRISSIDRLNGYIQDADDQLKRLKEIEGLELIDG